MKRTEQKELRQDMEQAYRSMIKPIYVKWQAKLSNGAISEMFAYFIIQHQHEKVMNIFRKRSYRRRIYKKTRDELETLKVKQELENFEKSL